MNNEIERDELPADDLIEIHDPAIDPAEIMAEIRERIQKRREELGYVTQRFSSFGETQFPGRPEDVAYDPDLYDHLELANELYLQVETKADLQSSAALRVPILGSLWSMIREQAHQLVLFYVNREVSHQIGVNREIVSVLNKLATINVDQQREINKLQNANHQLRRRLEELEG